MTTEIVFPGIEEYLAPYYGFFRRPESRELAACYLTGLLMNGERKSVEPMPEKVNASERGMQRLLSQLYIIFLNIRFLQRIRIRL